MTGSLLTRLDRETRAYHAGADGAWRDLLRPAVTPVAYREQLVRGYGFEAPLEAALAYTPGLAGVIDLRSRQRSGLLVRDLLALGLTPGRVAALPQCMIAPFSSASEALGWLYVAERWVLVQDAVRRHVVARQPQLAGATSYLAAADDARWSIFADALEHHACSSTEAQRVVAGARAACRRAIDWFGGDAAHARGAPSGSARA